MLLTSQQFARLAGISMKKFYARMRSGTFRGLEAPIPGRPMWRREAVETYLREGRIVTRRQGKVA